MKLPLLFHLILFTHLSVSAQEPVINTQPNLDGGYVCYGKDAVIKSSVSNADTYQLQLKTGSTYSNYGGLGDASSGSITINLTSIIQNLVFKIVFSKNAIEKHSDDFHVIGQRPDISVQPQNQTQCFDSNLSFFVVDNSTYTYKWQRSDNGGSFTSSGLPGKVKNNDKYNLLIQSINSAEQNDSYRCLITDAQGCEVTSNAGTITVNTFGTIKPTTSSEFCEGDTSNFYTDGLIGSVDSYNWQFKDGLSTFDRLIDTENLVLSFDINGIPTNMNEVELSIDFNNSLMNESGTLSSGTCNYTRSRTGYITNPKPIGPAATVPDSVCGDGIMNLAITDLRTDWNWSGIKFGATLNTGATFETPSLSSSKYYYVAYTDTKGCRSNPDSVLAKVNKLPILTLGSIQDICPDAASFEIPFTNLNTGSDLFSLIKTSGNVNINAISDESISFSPLTIPLASNVINGDNVFQLNLKNSKTSCTSDSITVNLYVKEPTLITSEPSSGVICEDTHYTFNITGTGEGSLTYQWFFEGDSILGAQSNSLSITKAKLSDDGSYSCVISSECGNANSASATLTVNPKTRITTQPQDTEICANTSANFSVAAIGTGVLHYQWKKDGVNVGTDRNTLTLSPVPITNDGAKITCLVSGDCGGSLSMEATISVLALPVLPSAVDTGFCINSTAEALNAQSLVNHTLSWYSTTDSDEVSLVSIIPLTTFAGDTVFYVSQTNIKGCESERAALQVVISPELNASISTNIPSICPGGGINNSSLASISASNGIGIFSYQWKKDNVVIEGQTVSEYRILDGSNYSVQVKSGFCEIEKSTSVTLANFDFTAPTVTSNLPLHDYSLCKEANITLTASSSAGTYDFKWYDSPSSTFPILLSEILSLSNVKSTKSYYAAGQANIGLLTCETERKEVEVLVIPKLRITANVTPETCSGLSDGKVIIIPDPNTPVYEYKFDLATVFSSTNTFKDLSTGQYSIGIRSTEGCISDTSITIGIVPPPLFTFHPEDATNCDGNTVNFYVRTNAVYNIQWQKKLPGSQWVDVSNENDLKVSNVGSSNNPNNTQYRAIASTATCFTSSNPATLYVNEFTSTLDNQTSCAGSTFTLIPPSSIGTIQSYLWQKKIGSSGIYVDVQDSPDASFVINSTTLADSNNYFQVKVTFLKEGSSTCLRTSDETKLTVVTVNESTILSGNQNICDGESTTLKASGCNGVVVWSNNITLDSIVVNPSITTIYTAKCKIGDCLKDAINSLEVLVKPGITSPMITVTNEKYCFGDSAILTAALCSSQVVWSDNSTDNPKVIKGVGTYQYSAKCSANGCTSAASDVETIRGYSELLPGEITIKSDINCAGYNPGEINSVTNPSGGKGTLTISWEMSEGCSSIEPTWATISSATSNSYNPSALQKTTCYRRKVVDECKTRYSNVSILHIADDPTVIISSDKNTICSHETFTLTASTAGGSGACTIKWQKNLKSSAPTSSFWENIDGQNLINSQSTIENTAPETKSVYFRSIYDCSLSSCNRATSEAFEIQVAPILNVSIGANKTKICSGESIDLTATGCLGTLVWSDTNSDAIRTYSPIETGFIVASCSNFACNIVEKDSLLITVNPGTAAPNIIATSNEICFSDSSILFTSSVCEGTILWSTGAIENQITVKPTNSQTYSAVCKNDKCTSPTSNIIAINGYPELVAGTIIMPEDTNCVGYNSGQISSQTEPSGGKGTLTISWEMSENCTSIEPTWATISSVTSNSYNPSALLKTTCYRRKVVDDCKTLYSNVSTIHMSDDPSVIVSSDKNTICSNETFTLTASPAGGAGPCNTSWQKNLKSSASSSSYWENISGNNLTNTLSTIENSETETASVYFRAIYDCSLTSCNKATSDAFEVQVLPSSEVTLNFTDSAVCIGNTVNIVAANCGGTLKWSDGSTEIIKEVLITGSISYTVTCTSSCGTYSAIANVNAIPGIVPPVNSTNFSAIQPNILTFSAIGTNLKWYAFTTIDTSLSNAPSETEIGEYSYWVSQSNALCESPRLEISSVIYSPLTILNQPINQYDCEGNSVNFTVNAIGAGYLHYQWQRKRPGESDFTNLTDEDEGIRSAQFPYLRVSAVGDKDNPNLSEFRCLISDSLNYVLSHTKVLYANIIEGTLPNLKTCQGTDFEIKLYDFVKTTGDILNFQWQIKDNVTGAWQDIKNDFRTSGANSANLKINNIQPFDSKRYRCSLLFNTGNFHCTENTDQTAISVGTYPEQAGDLEVEYCQGETTKKLSFNAKPNDDKWYYSDHIYAEGTTKQPKPSSDSAGVFNYWFTTITKELCESPKAKYTVTIHPKPEPPISKTPLMVNEGSELIFNAFGENLKWFTSITGRTFKTENPVYTKIYEYTHYVSQSNEFGCESDRTLIVSFIQGTLGFKSKMIDKADCDGNSVRFYSNGKGIEPLIFQWEKRLPSDSLFTIIENETSNNLLVSNIGSSNNPDSTEFRVTVTDSTGTEVSNVVYLKVNEIKGVISSQWLCEDDSWRVNIGNLDIQGDVNQYELQFKNWRSWVTLDSAYNADSNWVSKSLSFLKEKVDTLNNLDFRLRVVFNSENEGTCARSTDEFNFNSKERPLPFGDYKAEGCQFSSIEFLDADSTQFQFFSNQNDSSQIFNPKEAFGDSSGMFKYFFAVQDSITSCLSTKSSFTLSVLPADSVKLANNEFAFCTDDTSSLFTFDYVLSYSWFLNDSEQTAISDSLYIDLRTEADSSYWFKVTYSNGCLSPLEQIFTKVESCETNEFAIALEKLSFVEEKNPECSTFPNPFKTGDKPNLITQDLIYDEVYIYNSKGLKVLSEFRSETENYQKLNLNSDLEDGIYILRILDLSGNHCEWKMVKSL